MKIEAYLGLKGVYLIREERDRIATLNLAPKTQVYGEEIIERGKREFRVWNPYRSKLGAAILKGMDISCIAPGVKVLYLGSSTGTTVSHVSDIVGVRGRVFAVEISSRVMYEFIERVVRHRSNVFPIFEDARHPARYSDLVNLADTLYCDIAQPDQTEIAIENARLLLKDRGYLFLAIKARSIDVTKELNQVYREEREKFEDTDFKILDAKELDPYAKDHAMVTAQKRG